MSPTTAFLIASLCFLRLPGGDSPQNADSAVTSTQAAQPPLHELRTRVFRYASFAKDHRADGLASYYSSSLDGLPTANGEIFRNRLLTAAHLTLPLGSWIEVRSRATGRAVRCRVNDRGPYARKFFLDLSQAAASAIGVDRAHDRYVTVRLIALPGEEPMEEISASRIALTEDQGASEQ
ncbi:MAG TPA: septal ring lytic transglycosylase RlpA family protein [Thermoanaerobaculia bacterium]|nr:septal ring lytic transglycosylase RlpA family protein [Thermoanaerobaculia bacterium]